MEFITPQERAQIEARLKDLLVNRSVISNRIAEARALGDLKENGEYHAAREQQGMEEAEIRRLEHKLANAQVVDGDQHTAAGVVFLGSMVKIRDVDNGSVDLVKLVGEASDNPPDEYDEVTVSSPMGEALMKARVGDVIRVSAPRGLKKFEIIELE